MDKKKNFNQSLSAILTIVLLFGPFSSASSAQNLPVSQRTATDASIANSNISAPQPLPALAIVDDWEQQAPASKPSARNSHAMAYIGVDKVLLFGGVDSIIDEEPSVSDISENTWIYDLSANSWTQMAPSGGTKPSSRAAHAMAYIGDDKVLLFGGVDEFSNDETWVYDRSDNT